MMPLGNQGLHINPALIEFVHQDGPRVVIEFTSGNKFYLSDTTVAKFVAVLQDFRGTEILQGKG